MATKVGEASNWFFRFNISPPPGRLAELFGESAKEFTDFRPAWPLVFRRVMQGIARNVSTRGASLGFPWPGLKNKYYLARKARMGWSRAEMKATGRLLGSVGPISQGRRFLKVGTSVPYSKAIQWGKGV